MANIKSVTFLCFHMLFLADLVTGDCWPGWTAGNHGTCYLMKDAPTQWIEAEFTCKTLHQAKLAELESVQEYKDLIELIRNNSEVSKSDSIWLGATDIQVEGKWEWVRSGGVMAYNLWAPGQPSNNDGHGHTEHCLDFGQAYNYTFNDSNCNKAFPYICEKKGYIISGGILFEVGEDNQEDQRIEMSY